MMAKPMYVLNYKFGDISLKYPKSVIIISNSKMKLLALKTMM